MWIATAIHIISHENGRLVAFDSGNTTHCIKKYTATPYKRLPPPRVPPEISSTGGREKYCCRPIRNHKMQKQSQKRRSPSSLVRLWTPHSRRNALKQALRP
jgi:hypothetical protein